MQIKVFSAPELHKALSLVRQGLGPDAVILDRHQCTDEKGNNIWHVHAARDLEIENLPASGVNKENELYDKLGLATRRLEHIAEGFGQQEMTRLRASLSGDQTRHAFDELIRLGVAPDYAHDLAEDFAMRKPLAESFFHQVSALDPATAQEIVLLAGPCGGGKTTMAAKIAVHFSLQGVNVAFMSTDTERVGGLSMLQSYADVLEAPLIPLHSTSDISPALLKTKSARLLLVDTAAWMPGRMSNQGKQVELWRHIPCSRRFVVIPANIDEVDGNEALSYARSLGITELAPSKLDETARPGKLVNWLASGATISYCSFGPEVSDQIGWLSSKALTALLASHVKENE